MQGDGGRGGLCTGLIAGIRIPLLLPPRAVGNAASITSPAPSANCFAQYAFSRMRVLVIMEDISRLCLDE